MSAYFWVTLTPFILITLLVFVLWWFDRVGLTIMLATGKIMLRKSRNNGTS